VLWLESASGSATNGNQYVANLKFDGRYVSESNKGSWGGIRVNARSNVTIRNCTITGFYDNGVIFSDHQGYNTAFPPIAHFALIINFTIIYLPIVPLITRQLWNWRIDVGWPKDFLCYNNTIQQNERVIGYNGWPIKYYGSGALRNMKFYNNRVIKIPLVGGYMGQGGWTFAWKVTSNMVWKYIIIHSPEDL